MNDVHAFFFSDKRNQQEPFCSLEFRNVSSYDSLLQLGGERLSNAGIFFSDSPWECPEFDDTTLATLNTLSEHRRQTNQVTWASSGRSMSCWRLRKTIGDW